ncbi:hypothetical protein [Halobacteriaceae bacterium SHR40]|uniref:hypothetical protein n=1 Tax=Halovenus amylolytica TaxID=2500550 RepID=UPI000FE2AD7F
MSSGSEVLAALEAAATDSPALSVDANLALTVDGTKLAVSASGDRIRIQIPSVRAAVALFGSERQRLPTVSETLTHNGLTAEIRIGDAVVALLGTAAAPSPFSKPIWGEAVEIRPGEVLAAALRLK